MTAPPPEDDDEATPSTLDVVGVACFRAALVAGVVGTVEATLVATSVEVKVPGFAPATAGLWIPAALVLLFPAHLLRGLEDPVLRRRLAFAFGVVIAAAALFARLAPKIAPHLSPQLRAAPLELAAAIGLLWAATEVQLAPPLRRFVAVAGIVFVVVLQVWSTRFVDAHRALAGALVEATFVPRLLLKLVLRKFV